MKILITRPLQQSRRFAKALDKQFGESLEICISPVLEIKFFRVEINLEPFDGLIFTSESGVKAFTHLNKKTDKKVYCVGAYTSEVARKSGLSVSHTEKDVGDLKTWLIENDSERKLLYLCGQNISNNLEVAFEGSKTTVVSQIIYDQLSRKLSPSAIQFLSGVIPVLIPIFSERSYEILSQQFKSTMSSSRIAICLSEAIANKIKDDEFEKVLISAQPDLENLIKVVRESLKNS